MLFIHRLVLEAFVGPCPAGMEACHFPDRDPDNNHLENLRWGTKSDNAKDAMQHGTHSSLRAGEQNNRSKLTEQQVRQIIYTHRTGIFSQEEIAEQYGISQVAVSHIVLKKSWKHLWT
jgi:predicted XRE-type DNA-binding protein